MEELLALKGKKVAILATGPKGVVSIKGVLIGVTSDFIVVEQEKGGLVGGKKTTQTYFTKYNIVGVRVEE